MQYTDRMTGPFHISFILLMTLSTPVNTTTTCQSTMPQGKQFYSAEKSKIMAWYFEEVPAKEIAKRLNRDLSAVHRIIRLNKNLPMAASPLPPKKRSGRPREHTRVQEERLRRYILRHPFKTAKQLKFEVPGWSDASVWTIQDTCNKRLGLPSRCAAKKHLLTDKMVKKRLAFCKKFKSWTAEEWETVMFSDKSTFAIINPRAQKVRRPSFSLKPIQAEVHRGKRQAFRERYGLGLL